MRVWTSPTGRWLATVGVAVACVTATATPATAAQVRPSDSFGVAVYCDSTFHAFTCHAEVTGGHAPFTHAWSTSGFATITDGNGKDISGTCSPGTGFTVVDHATDDKGRTASGSDTLTCSDIE
jgi:hypothetical protein